MLAALEPWVTYGYCWDIESQPIDLGSLVDMLDRNTDIGMLIVYMYFVFALYVFMIGYMAISLTK